MDNTLVQKSLKDRASDLFIFTNKQYFYRAISHKSHEQEIIDKKGQYQFGNYEDYVIIGHSFLEILFLDYMLDNGYPSQATTLKKTGDIIILRQNLFKDANFEEISRKLKIDQVVQVGKSLALKQNTKVLVEVLKSLVAAQYFDRGKEIDSLKEVVSPIIALLLEKQKGSYYLFLKRNNSLEIIQQMKPNYKSFYYDYIQKNPHIKTLVTFEEKQQEKGSKEPLKDKFSMNLTFGNYQIKSNGPNKKSTEEELYKQFHDKIKTLSLDEIKQLSIQPIEQQQEQNSSLKPQNQVSDQEIAAKLGSLEISDFKKTNQITMAEILNDIISNCN